MNIETKITTSLKKLSRVHPRSAFRKDIESLVYPPRARARAQQFSIISAVIIFMLTANFAMIVAASQAEDLVYPVKRAVENIVGLSINNKDINVQPLSSVSPTPTSVAISPTSTPTLTPRPIQGAATTSSINVSAPTSSPTVTPTSTVTLPTKTDVQVTTPVLDVGITVKAPPQPTSTQSESSTDSTHNGAGSSVLPNVNVHIKLPKIGL